MMCSFVLRPRLEPRQAGLLTLLAGAALAEASRSLGADAGCTWPNDLMTPDGKAGGILAESAIGDGALRHVVIGTGVNLGGAPAGVPGAAALAGVEAAPLLEAYLRAFALRYRPDEPGFAAEVVAAARAVSLTLGTDVEAARAGDEVSGRAVDLDEEGGLVVDTGSGLVTIAFGELVRVRR
jgi:BirA family biotin operon repressor/biotin-[acetyl-CoA-carboxylase] ligase